MIDLETKLVQKITNFIYWLVEVEELAIAKALRQILVEKQKQLHSQTVNVRYFSTVIATYLHGNPEFHFMTHLQSNLVLICCFL